MERTISIEPRSVFLGAAPAFTLFAAALTLLRGAEREPRRVFEPTPLPG